MGNVELEYMRFEILDTELAELHVSAEERWGAEPLLLCAELKDDRTLTKLLPRSPSFKPCRLKSTGTTMPWPFNFGRAFPLESQTNFMFMVTGFDCCKISSTKPSN